MQKAEPWPMRNRFSTRAVAAFPALAMVAGDESAPWIGRQIANRITNPAINRYLRVSIDASFARTAAGKLDSRALTHRVPGLGFASSSATSHTFTSLLSPEIPLAIRRRFPRGPNAMPVIGLV